MPFFNPHEKHGFLTGDYDGDFWVALESTYKKLEEELTVNRIANTELDWDLGSLFRLAYQYRILNRIHYTSHSGGVTIGARLESRIRSAEIRAPSADSEESLAVYNFLHGCYRAAAEELRRIYGPISARPCRPRIKGR